MSDEKDQKKTPVDFQDILDAEKDSYIIVVGTDLLMHKNHLSFTKRVAEGLYAKLWFNLNRISKEGTEEEKAEAIRQLSSMQIMPLRIH